MVVVIRLWPFPCNYRAKIILYDTDGCPILARSLRKGGMPPLPPIKDFRSLTTETNHEKTKAKAIHGSSRATVRKRPAVLRRAARGNRRPPPAIGGDRIS